jgi:light-regulated signal transduction histidine kinase (bacteriophytochrome)
LTTSGRAIQTCGELSEPRPWRLQHSEGSRAGNSEQAYSEVLRRCEELEITNRKLVKANEDLSHFAYIASHDLQEPLRTMAASSQLFAMRSRAQLDAESDRFISYIISETARMRATIVSLIDLRTVIELAIANLSSAIDENEATISYGELPILNADAAQLVQVFQNLFGNALKYRNPKQKARAHVSAERSESGDWLVAVQDNGIGFEARYAEQIFEVFKRLHDREVSGAGIGLAICKRIIESHGGRIWAASKPGAGSTFCFTIPELGRV